MSQGPVPILWRKLWNLNEKSPPCFVGHAPDDVNMYLNFRVTKGSYGKNKKEKDMEPIYGSVRNVGPDPYISGPKDRDLGPL